MPKLTGVQTLFLNKKPLSLKADQGGFINRNPIQETTESYDLGDGRRSIPVEIVSLDDYFKNIKNPIDFIKIDVQGAEMAVIDGMSDLLSDPSKTKNLQTLIEFCPLALEQFGSDAKEFLKNLDSWGLKIRLLDPKKNNAEPIRPESLTWDHWTREGYVNLLCSRKTA